jgi:hypothetical protein
MGFLMSLGLKKAKSKGSKYKVVNWREYNESLKQRGSLTVWLSDDFEKSWFADKDDKPKRGRPLLYSQVCIQLILTLRHLFKLALRQVIGFVGSLFSLLKKSLPVPEFSRLSKRCFQSLSRIPLPSVKEPTHLVIDSTGLKVFGEKEWLETKHGKQYQRKVWRKLHIGIGKDGHIVSRVLTDHRTDDRTCVGSLLEPVDTQFISEVLADGGYDSHQIYRDLEKEMIKSLISPPSKAVVSCSGVPTLRDKAVQYIKDKGYWAWYHKNDFGRRNKVENTFYRLKTIFGRKLSSRNPQNQDAESLLICHLLNQMTDLGMLKTVKIT